MQIYIYNNLNFHVIKLLMIIYVAVNEMKLSNLIIVYKNKLKEVFPNFNIKTINLAAQTGKHKINIFDINYLGIFPY